ncbi:transporter associated domain-containing protein, partial [Microbacterium sp.]
TLEDLVEEVVGEIFDEYDAEVFISADDGLDGRLNLQDFEEATGLAMPRGSSDTIAGFVTEQLGRLAVVGDTVEVPGATIQVAEVDRRRIARVRVSMHTDPGAERGTED